MRTQLPDAVTLQQTQAGLERLVANTPAAKAVLYLQGAHLANWKPAGQKHDVLWMSAKSHFAPDKPIRGGVPVCFPWFGAKADDPAAPMHGWARVRPWTLQRAESDEHGQVLIDLVLAGDSRTRQSFPHDFEIRHRLAIGPTLTMTLEVRNTGQAPFTFEEALHTYLTVGDARRARVLGLAGTDYLDKVDDLKRKTQGQEALTVSAETDRLYLDTTAACTLEDPALGRRIRIDKAGSNSTVVWNPWTAKARAMPDFGDEEWPGMICIETANAGANAVTLAPGATHSMSATISVEWL